MEWKEYPLVSKWYFLNFFILRFFIYINNFLSIIVADLEGKKKKEEEKNISQNYKISQS